MSESFGQTKIFAQTKNLRHLAESQRIVLLFWSAHFEMPRIVFAYNWCKKTAMSGL
jgi:hypothetical protein